MRDEFDLQIEYHNSFVEWLADMGTRAKDIEDIGVVHGDQQIYCVFGYTDIDSGKREWGVLGGMDFTASNQCQIIFSKRPYTQTYYDALVDARKELFEEWDIPVKELLE